MKPQPAFVLHRRNYRDTSLIIELFTLHNGRISVVAKGAKRAKSPLRHSLHLFQPMFVLAKGQAELQTLIQAESIAPLAAINQAYLAWAFYLNELLFRLLGKHDPYPKLFHQYQDLLHHLTGKNIEEKQLRLFEYDLLTELGYGLQLATDANNEPLNSTAYYHCMPQHAPVKTRFKDHTTFIYSGNSLLALQTRQLDTSTALHDAKRLLRYALQQLLGNKPLKSRELLI